MAASDIKLRQGAASSKDIRLYPGQAATAVAATTIRLRAGHATPSSIVLGDGSATGVIAGNFVLAATESADTAAFNVQEGFQLAATEAADTAAVALVEGANLDLAATEGPDVAAFVLGDTLALAATEAEDVAAFNVELTAVDIDLAASEEPDTAAFEMAAVAVAVPVTPAAPLGSGGWRGGGERGTTAIYGPLRQQKRKLRRLIEAGEAEDVSRSCLTAARQAHTREEIVAAIRQIEAELQRIDDEDDDDMMLLAA